jgi:membrane protein implicated in regulation of membrane protease activity
MISVFNPQTVVLLLGFLLLVAGVWALLGWQWALVALGMVLIVIAVLINRNDARREVSK